MIFDSIYAIISTFFPSALLDIPFFEFLSNLLFFAFCCLVFSMFFVYPLLSVFKWVKSKIKGGF